MEPSKAFIGFLSRYKNLEDLIESLFLQSIVDSYSRVRNIKNIATLSENKIRNKFQFDLENSNQLIKVALNNNFVTFVAERQIINKEKELMRSDIEFIINPTIRFVVECKKVKGVNKKQYIEDGILRFINPDKYIKPDEKYAGMCSFVVQGDINNLIKGTLQRIEKYHWLNTNTENICNFENSFSTNHKKIDNNEIMIYHLFFDMNKK